jgi:hypothetical protein
MARHGCQWGLFYWCGVADSLYTRKSASVCACVCVCLCENQPPRGASPPPPSPRPRKQGARVHVRNDGRLGRSHTDRAHHLRVPHTSLSTHHHHRAPSKNPQKHGDLAQLQGCSKRAPPHSMRTWPRAWHRSPRSMFLNKITRGRAVPRPKRVFSHVCIFFDLQGNTQPPDPTIQNVASWRPPVRASHRSAAGATVGYQKVTMKTRHVCHNGKLLFFRHSQRRNLTIIYHQLKWWSSLRIKFVWNRT